MFISYGHKDEPWLERQRVHLKPVERLHGIDVWHDKKISPGMSRHDEITQALGSAKVAVLLATADFLAPQSIDREEIPPLLEAARAGAAVILPVIVNHSRFSDIESLSRHQAVNDASPTTAGGLWALAL